MSLGTSFLPDFILVLISRHFDFMSDSQEIGVSEGGSSTEQTVWYYVDILSVLGDFLKTLANVLLDLSLLW